MVLKQVAAGPTCARNLFTRSHDCQYSHPARDHARRYQQRVDQHTRSQAAADQARPPGEEKPADVVFEGGLHIPGDLYARLFDYQKTGVYCLTATANNSNLDVRRQQDRACDRMNSLPAGRKYFCWGLGTVLWCIMGESSCRQASSGSGSSTRSGREASSAMKWVRLLPSSTRGCRLRAHTLFWHPAEKHVTCGMCPSCHGSLA